MIKFLLNRKIFTTFKISQTIAKINLRQCSSLQAAQPKSKAVGLWLLGCSGMVFGAITIGGVTRLTESGLSMVNWSLIKGMKPPSTEDEWNAEFKKYQDFPEYKYKSSMEEMTLSNFKRIWYMEYFHRMWGRSIGLAFLVPATYFWVRGYFKKAMKQRVVIFGSLLIAQGLFGWYMVKSGLDETNLTERSSIPRVSQYRLATHLFLALTLYSGLLWSSMEHLFTRNNVKNVGTKVSPFLRIAPHLLLTMVLTTALSGAFVAGLDAGLTYNSWPKMADSWIPSDLFHMKPIWKNIFENPTTVQFNHRHLAEATGISTLLLWLVYRKSNVYAHKRPRLAMNVLAGITLLQISLGVCTLVMHVPVWLASIHQSGSVTVLTAALWLANELKHIPK